MSLKITARVNLKVEGQVSAAAQKAFVATALALDRELKLALSDPVWEWPNQPSPRDIVDTGQLRASQTMVFSPTSVSFAWPVAYAAAVHEGVSYSNGTILPPRKWTDLAVDRLDPVAYFKAQM